MQYTRTNTVSEEKKITTKERIVCNHRSSFVPGPEINHHPPLGIEMFVQYTRPNTV